MATRRQFLVNAVSGVMSSAVLTHPASLVPRRSVKPNIVFILLDDLGYGDLSCYGAADLQTPNIDRLMEAGMRFNQFYANCPVCSPTRASLLTGCYPDRVGVPGVIRTHRENSWGHLASDAVLLPQVLKPAGYHCAIVGKWHLGLEAPNTPLDRGFDHFHGFLGDMMDDYYTHRRHDINYMRLDKEEIDPEGHATDLFSAWACDYIAECAAASRPFFLYLAYNAPHTPIQPPDAWLKRVRERAPELDENRANLVALIEHVDDGIGRVMEALEKTGMSDNTLILFTSDNGGQGNVGARNAPLRGEKQQMFEGGIRVPMCAVWPGRIPEKTTSNRVAMTMDLFPTLVEVAGTTLHHEVDGCSLLPTLHGKEQALEDRTLFWVRREGGEQYGGRDYYAARKGPWKLLQNTPFEPMQLYNLDEDPGETTPLDRKHPMYKELSKAIRDHINDSGTVPWQRPHVKS